MTWEDKAKELASKATPGPWKADNKPSKLYLGKTGVRNLSDIRTEWIVWPEVAYKDSGADPDDTEHIAHNDPTTIALVAEVVAAAREVANGEDPFYRLLDALAALDTHVSGRARGEGDTLVATRVPGQPDAH